MPKRRVWFLVVVTTLLLLVVWWTRRASDTTDAPPSVPSAQAAAADGRNSSLAKRGHESAAYASPHQVGLVEVASGSTPPLDVPFSPDDGVLEIRVQANGAPIPNAAVRVYFQNGYDGSTGVVDWRYAGGGTTNAHGRIDVAAQAGSYLVAARASGFAAGHVAAVKPALESRTRVQVVLSAGHALWGRTVARGSREAVPNAELVLAPLAVAVESVAGRRTAPAEELVLASSDTRGEFRVEGLAEGSWHLEARAPTYAMTRVRNVRVPALRPLIVELSSSSFLAGYIVRSNGQPAPGAELIIVGTEQQTATAGDRGDFSVEVAPGSYLLSARSDDETGALSDPISVAPGATRDGLRITLEASSAVEGVVVARSTGQPIAGAVLSLSPHGAEGDSGRATTGPDGRFRIAPVAAGAFDLEARATGYSTELTHGVSVSQGQTFTTEFRLSATGTVEGTVTDAAKRPVAGVHVRVGHRWWTQDPEVRVGTTQTDGTYRIEGVQLGTRLVTASRADAAPGTSKSVDVMSGHVARVDLQLRANGVMTGRVLRPDGKPVTVPAQVSVIPADQTRFGPHERTHLDVAPDGVFRAELPAGDWSVAAFPAAAPQGSFGPRNRVTVEEGKTTTVELTLPGDDANTLAGVVLEPDGGPSARAVVSLRLNGKPRMAIGTAPDGTFRISLATLAAEAGATPVWSLHAQNGGRQAELDKVSPGSQPVTLQLRPGGVVRGRVRASAGAEITAFTAWWELIGDGRGINTGRHGELQFAGDAFVFRDVAPGRARIVAATADGRRGSAEVRVSAGQEVTQDVTLEPGVRVRARIVDATSGAPVQDVVPAVDDGAPEYRRASGANGEIVLEVAPGTHTVRFAGAWRQPTTKSVSAVPAQSVDLGDVAMPFIAAEKGTIGARFLDVKSATHLGMILPGGPAQSAGLRDGDTVLAIDGVSVTSAQDATMRSMGAPGSTTVLRIRRSPSSGEEERPVVRAQ